MKISHALLGLGALLILGDSAFGQTKQTELRMPSPMYTNVAPLSRGGDRRDLQSYFQRAINAEYGRPVVIQEAWMFREWNGFVTVCGAAIVEPNVIGVFVLQQGGNAFFTDVYADEQQFKRAGCERAGAETIFPPKLD